MYLGLGLLFGNKKEIPVIGLLSVKFGLFNQLACLFTNYACFHKMLIKKRDYTGMFCAVNVFGSE